MIILPFANKMSYLNKNSFSLKINPFKKYRNQLLLLQSSSFLFKHVFSVNDKISRGKTDSDYKAKQKWNVLTFSEKKNSFVIIIVVIEDED
jgi:hypothetical protein